MVLATDGIDSGFAQAIAAGGPAQDIADADPGRARQAGRRRARRRRALPGRGMTAARTVRVAADVDVASAAREARGLAEECGLSGVEAQHVATAVSEVATNAVKYARGGEVELAPAEHAGRRGLQVTVRDRGPGIADVAAALRDGVSSSGSLGLGLPGARRLMDDFSIRSDPRGTVVAMARWEGGLLATHGPAACTVRKGQGGVAVAQAFRNGLLLGVAAGRAGRGGRAVVAHAAVARAGPARRPRPRRARPRRAGRPRGRQRERARRPARLAARRRRVVRAAARRQRGRPVPAPGRRGQPRRGRRAARRDDRRAARRRRS